MNNNPTDLRRLRFDESVRSPNWVFILFGALLGLFAGLLTGLPISGVLQGTESIIFYAVLGVAMLIVLFVMLNFLALLTTISDHGLEFRLGLFARRFSWNQIAGAEAKPYNPLSYGGWGIRIAYGGRRAWSLPGVSHGVEVRVTDPQRTGTHLLRLLGPPRRYGSSASTRHRRTPRGAERGPVDQTPPHWCPYALRPVELTP